MLPSMMSKALWKNGSSADEFPDIQQPPGFLVF
jgi:hypothetical protein